MRPRIQCSSCNAPLAWGQESCPSCGTPVEWPAGSAERKKSGASKPVPRTSMFPARNIAILVGVIALGVVGLELLTSPRPVPASSGSPAPSTPAPMSAQQPQGPDMSAVPHIQELEDQLKANPANQELRKDLGNHLMDARFYDRAIAVYKEFLARSPKDANVRVDLGICYKEQGEFDAAIREMKSALTIDPRHLNAHFNLGVVYLVKGDLQESNRWFQKTVELGPTTEVGQRAQQLLQQHSSIPAP